MELSCCHSVLANLSRVLMTSHKAQISYYVYSDCNNAVTLTCLHREADGDSVLDSVLNPRDIHHYCDRVTADVHVLGSLVSIYADCSVVEWLQYYLRMQGEALCMYDMNSFTFHG